MIRWIAILVICIGCERTKGFALKKISSRTATHVNVSGQTAWLQSIFDEPLNYIGSGNHTYAFETSDKKYVVKFFKQNHFGPFSWRDYLPLPDSLNPNRETRKKDCLRARAQTFESVQIASKELKQLTGVIYTHLNRTSDIKRKVQLIDLHGACHICSIDRMEFFIQKKAEVGFAAVQALIQREEFDLALERLAGFLELVKARCQKGYADRDLQLFKNFGFVDDQPIEIDVGDFRADEQVKSAAVWKAEVEHVSCEVAQFLKDHAPLLSESFEARKAEILK